MDYAIVCVPAAPVRKKARHQSEMTSQLLFGEKVRILKSKHSLWLKVRSLHDNYEGWLTKTMLTGINEEQAARVSDHVTIDLINTIMVQDREMKIPVGSSLPEFGEGKGIIGEMPYVFTGNHIKRGVEQPGAERIKQLSFQWLNAPYMWGGRTMFGVDCSGFVQVNFKMLGIDLPRDAWQQAQVGKTVNKLSDVVCGDLAFFDDKEEIVHVGILLGNDQIIHSSGKVRIDTIDKKGIVNTDTGKRTHSLRLIKRCW